MSRDSSSGYSAKILDSADVDDLRFLAELRANRSITVIDRLDLQSSALAALLPPPDSELLGERTRWAYYPWRRTVVHVLGPRAYRRVRLDRNRNLISLEELQLLSVQRIAVVGLSVGHSIAHTLAMQGLCGELRLADFDDVDLSNLNRIPATIFDLDVNKAVAVARRIAEIDPYIVLTVFDAGVTGDNIGEFLDGVDIVVEECDSLDMKAVVREAARERRQPVLMATSHRGLLDVERFDLEPERPIFHGLLDGVPTSSLAGLTSREKIPHVLRIVDAAGLSARGAASLLEVGHTLATWPQTAGDVALGASAVAEAVRRIGLGEALSSGRGPFDVSAALDDLTDPMEQPRASQLAAQPALEELGEETADVASVVAASAAAAPSGGNTQPWLIETAHDAVVVSLAPQHKSVMDVGFRGSAVAVGAAVFNARVTAAANHVLGGVEFTESDSQSPLRATVRLDGQGDAGLARLHPALTKRETNRHRGIATAIPPDTVGALKSAAAAEGARLELLTSRSDIERAATLFAAADRIRYLTPRLHADMVAELRWPGDDAAETGIDVHSLELDEGELLTLDILRRPEVMSMLAEWDAGSALGADTLARMRASSALAVVSVRGNSLADYARGGSAAEAVWVTAQDRGLAVQPMSPVFLYANDDDERSALSPTFTSALRDLQAEFRQVSRTAPDETHALVLRFALAPSTSVRSRRRTVKNAHPPLP